MSETTDALSDAAVRVIDQCFDHGLESLAPRDRILFLAWCYAGEIDNGGHAQFFYNTCGEFAAETADALRALVLLTHAEVLEEAVGTLFPGGVPRDMDARNDAVMAHGLCCRRRRASIRTAR